MAGVSRLDSSLRTTSMPRCRATATMQLSLPRSNPTTLIFDSASAPDRYRLDLVHNQTPLWGAAWKPRS
uniref:Uncharacterized protein n=1 Tax=Arundo donax TaxID=35708 RepID=A0A0A9FCR4_ARUDO